MRPHNVRLFGHTYLLLRTSFLACSIVPFQIVIWEHRSSDVIMARKKKTIAMKRNKPPAAAVATTTVVESASPVQFLEGIDKFLMDDGKHLDFQRLMKCMPYVVQQLKEGTLSQEEFKEDVTAAFRTQYDSRNVYMDFNSIFLSISIRVCKPGPPICGADTRENIFRKEFADNIFDAFFQVYKDFRDLPDEAYCEASILSLQKSTEKTC